MVRVTTKYFTPFIVISCLLAIGMVVKNSISNVANVRRVKYPDSAKLARVINSIETNENVQCDCNPSNAKCRCIIKLDEYRHEVHHVDLMTASMLVSSARIREPTHDKERVVVLRYNNSRLGVVYSDEPMMHYKVVPESDSKIGTKFNLQQPWMCEQTPQGLPCNETRSIHYELIGSQKQWIQNCDVLNVFIHGFFSSPRTNEPIIDGLERYNTKHFKSYCILAVDWSAAAWGIYDHTAVNVITVGRQLALLLYYMIILEKVECKDIHLIGHSLGAQVCHYTNMWLQHLSTTYPDPSDPATNATISDWQIGRITALDPAAEGFQPYPGAYVMEQDAAFVDVIHTSIVSWNGGWRDIVLGHYGMSLLIGSIDFFPNGGTTGQPACRGIEWFDLSCSHRLVTDYFRDSMVDWTHVFDEDTPVYPSVECASWKAYNNCLTSTPYPRSSMGMQAIKFSGRGRHYLPADTWK